MIFVAVRAFLRWRERRRAQAAVSPGAYTVHNVKSSETATDERKLADDDLSPSAEASWPVAGLPKLVGRLPALPSRVPEGGSRGGRTSPASQRLQALRAGTDARFKSGRRTGISELSTARNFGSPVPQRDLP